MSFKRIHAENLFEIEEFLHRDDIYNAYILGDIKSYGLDSEVIDVWAYMGSDGIDCVLMRYLDSFVISPMYADIDSSEIIKCMEGVRIRTVSGCLSSIEKVATAFTEYDLLRTNLLVLDSDKSVKQTTERFDIKLLDGDDDDIISIQNIYLSTDEFSDKYAGGSKSRIREIFNNGRYYGCFNENTLIGVASVSADSGTVGVLDGVAVIRSMQGIGAGKALVRYISYKEQKRGRRIAVYTDSQIANHIYEGVGFKQYGEYCMLYPR